MWFDTEGEEAATFYTSVFPNSKIVNVTHYGPAGPREEGMVLTVELRAERPEAHRAERRAAVQFTEAISLHVSCESQEEVDAYWSALSEGGEEGPCGWLKDRFGVSWQIDPIRLQELLPIPIPDRAERAMRAMLEMKKIDIAELERARPAASRARARRHAACSRRAQRISTTCLVACSGAEM